MSEESLVSDARSIFESAVRSVQADRLLGRADLEEWLPDSLSEYETIRVVGMGKAGMAMAGVFESRFSELELGGVVVVPEGYPTQYPDFLPSPDRIRVIEGGHPLPTDASARAGRRILDQAEAVDAGDLLLVLISGGGTALSSLPADDLDVPDLRTTYQRIMNAGIAIHPANVVRKHLTQIGGGQLARTAHPGHVGALAVSDVPGDDLSTIASGPTVPDPSTFEEAMQVLYRHELWHNVPQSVRDRLAAGARGKRPETPGEDDSCFATTKTTLIGSNDTALKAARARAEELGYTVRSVSGGVEGEARDVGNSQAGTLNEASVAEPTCWIWGGETTVTVTGEGKGGRNQEVALGAALTLEEEKETVLLSGGTDGIDGPTDAAGAWATPETRRRAEAAGYDPRQHLEDNDAYRLFDAIDQLLRPGPTHTNVMDVQIGLVRPSI